MIDETQKKNEIALLAGGCFWCMQPPYEKVAGVQLVIAGYAGGMGENPTYDTFAQKGYIEAVKVIYDPEIISYKKLLETFWQNIDPTDVGGQFADRGKHYQTAIFYFDDEQKKLAGQSKKELEQSGKFAQPIVTKIIPATTFYPAEGYHQDYYKKNPEHYASYKYHSGREPFLKKMWEQDDSTHKKN